MCTDVLYSQGKKYEIKMFVSYTRNLSKTNGLNLNPLFFGL